MCGITGFWDFKGQFSQEKDALHHMTNTLRPRGPDSEGYWQTEQGVGLGFRRLAIQDLSPLGNQPMISPDGRFVIIFNGEIYNAGAVRAQLEAEGISFRGHSDTEVLLMAAATWGVEPAVQACLGMFAFALWDHRAQQLFLVRDRVGIKPLYWGFQRSVLLFGSELKALRAHPAFEGKIQQEALALYFRYNYVPTPFSIYEGIFKQRPGTILTIDHHGQVLETVYWSHPRPTDTQVCQNPSKTTQDLHQLLLKVVEEHMVSDVPLGAFLSGGIDSSLVVALMQAQRTSPIQTFSIGFEEAGYNEAHHAAAVAQHLKTDHHELYVSPDQARSVIPELPLWYDEPFADVSQIPTYLVSKLAKEHVTVALSGDGGDEAFAGYNRYIFPSQIWPKLQKCPLVLRKAMASLIELGSPRLWDKLAHVIPTSRRPSALGEKLHKVAHFLPQQTPEDLYSTLVTFWPDPEELLQQTLPQGVPILPAFQTYRSGENITSWMQYVDLLTYLPDDILTKVDRASMAVSLEARVPLLDTRILEFAATVPLDLRFRRQTGKVILREILATYVPRAFFERPKMGFGVPIDSWLRGPLRAWAEELLNPHALEAAGLNPDPIRAQWAAHLTGSHNHQYALWGVLMYQSWILNHK